MQATNAKEKLHQTNSLRLKHSKWSCVSHTSTAADLHAAAIPDAPLNQAWHRPKPISNRSVQPITIPVTSYKRVSGENFYGREYPMSIPLLAIPRLPGKHWLLCFPPALSPHGWKQAGAEDHPWTCSSRLSTDSCPTGHSCLHKYFVSQVCSPQTLPFHSDG